MILQEYDEEIMNSLMIQNINQQRQLHGVVINATLRFWSEYIERFKIDISNVTFVSVVTHFICYVDMWVHT